jgi:hypothetical protein
MAISLAVAQLHTATWQQKHRNFPGKAGWAEHLFHACQVEVAVRVVQDGELRCRDDAGDLICDVANQGAVWNNPSAHKYARLYFRPRNSFHLKTEGIKRLGDPYRQAQHMSMPVMLAFDFEKVMTWQHSFFLPGNFARTAAAPISGDANFAKLDFSTIYHDGATNTENRATIHDARMAEVVTDHAIPLSMLNAVICRTQHELATLRTLLSEAGVQNVPVLSVEKFNSLFMRKQIYISELYCSSGTIYLSITSPVAGWGNFSFRIYSNEFDVSGTFATPRMRLSSHTATNPTTVWTIEIEGCLAYHGPIPWAGGVV